MTVFYNSNASVVANISIEEYEEIKKRLDNISLELDDIEHKLNAKYKRIIKSNIDEIEDSVFYIKSSLYKE